MLLYLPSGAQKCSWRMLHCTRLKHPAPSGVQCMGCGYRSTGQGGGKCVGTSYWSSVTLNGVHKQGGKAYSVAAHSRVGAQGVIGHRKQGFAVEP
jgi:hypothetical protein